MDERHLIALGVDRSAPVAQQAAVVVRSMPLRWRPTERSRDPDTVVESRWFAGPAECHRVLANLYHGDAGRGSAFGVTWPFLLAAGRVVAPALPVVVGADEAEGPDGHYHTQGQMVWREAAGQKRPFIALHDTSASGATGFDLMWFGGSERYLLRDGMLEVEDLFSILRLGASPTLVERLVVRGLRVEREVLDHVSLRGEVMATEMEVRRPSELSPSERWRDPVRMLGARTDVSRVSRRGDEILVDTAGGKSSVYRLEEARDGWRVLLWDGDYPYRRYALHLLNDHLHLSVTLDDAIDPFAPGVRGQLAFDLRSDLVALD